MKKTALFAVIAGLTLSIASCKKDENQPAVFTAQYAIGDFYQFSCDTIGSIQSQLGTPSTNVYFNNKSSKTLKIVWVNFSGGMTVYEESLMPNTGRFQPTYLGHPWKITDAQDNCLTVLMAAEAGVTDTVTFVN